MTYPNHHILTLFCNRWISKACLASLSLPSLICFLNCLCSSSTCGTSEGETNLQSWIKRQMSDWTECEEHTFAAPHRPHPFMKSAAPGFQLLSLCSTLCQLLLQTTYLLFKIHRLLLPSDQQLWLHADGKEHHYFNTFTSVLTLFHGCSTLGCLMFRTWKSPARVVHTVDLLRCDHIKVSGYLL